MARLLITLRYDGTAYHGWQVQPNAVTVQELLQNAVESVTGVRAGITGCSRTDAGVHAEMFCCALDTDSPLRGDKMASALNFHLPRDIAVYDVREVDGEFHPRYHARGKRYVYRIWNGKQRHPVYDRYALHRKQPLDVDLLNRAAAGYVGTHDFAAFCAAGSDVQGTLRTVRDCRVERQGELVLFSVEADGFLYNMVRIMVGTLLEIADGRLSAEDIPKIIASCDREQAGPTAPAKGLCLQQVFYDDRVEQDTRTRLKAADFGAFHPICSRKAPALLRPNRIKTSQNSLALRSKILKRGNFCSIKAQNAVNPCGFTSILTKIERKSPFSKRYSDISLYPKEGG